MGGFCLTLATMIMLFGTIFAAKIRCSKEMSSATGIFTSPRYPNYPPNYHCEYTIKAKGSYFIEVNFTRFELQYPEKGVITDYIQILDGKSNNLQQNLTYNGSQTSPFTFRSETNEVKIIFISDEVWEYTGFKANYRFIKKCEAFALENAIVSCDKDLEDLATKCNVYCKEKYVLQGEAQVRCENGAFSKPQCVLDPDYSCNATRIQEYKPECDLDPVTGMIKKCEFSCQKDHYVALRNGTIECVDGALDDKPACLPDPDLMEMCLKKPESKKCLFSAEETEQYVKTIFEDTSEFEIDPKFGRSAGQPIVYKCNRQFCFVSKKTKKFFIKCKKYAKNMRKRLKESKEKQKRRENHCFSCQAVGCIGYGGHL